MNNVIRKIFRPRNDNQSLKQAIEEIMEDHEDNGQDVTGSEGYPFHERALISNILKLQDETVEDLMVPRADIVAVEEGTSQEDLLKLLSQYQYSRFPVYHETLDDIVGTIHIKDILAKLAVGEPVIIKDLVRTIPIVSPAMPVSDLILFMKENRKHMVLIVDEYGGIDGLVTLGDIIETIVGQIDDEYDIASQPLLIERQDGIIMAEGRVELEDFEEKFGEIFSEDDHEEADTLGGLVFSIAGRVPARGEVIAHENGLEFEILDADRRRINRLKIRNLDKAREAISSE